MDADLSSRSPNSPRPGAWLYFVVRLRRWCSLYALWPSRQKQFDEAARMPLRED